MTELPLFSLQMQSAAYNNETRRLQIRFKNGQLCTYSYVPAILFTMLTARASADRHYRQYIQGKYPVIKGGE